MPLLVGLLLAVPLLAVLPLVALPLVGLLGALLRAALLVAWVAWHLDWVHTCLVELRLRLGHRLEGLPLPSWTLRRPGSSARTPCQTTRSTTSSRTSWVLR